MLKALFLALCCSFSAWATAASTVTVSGLSSGGYFAQQLHVAHSSWIKGAGILAAGPYACAKFGLADAFYRCMETGLGLPEASDSLKEMRLLAQLKQIDPITNLSHSKVYLLSGTRDATVSPQVVVALAQLYQSLGVTPVFERNLAVGHAFPTRSFGNPCREPSKPPYISSCGRDIAGEILTTLLGNLRAPARAAKSSQLFAFSQSQTSKQFRLDRISMAANGVAYVPQSCRPLGVKSCPVHLAFHGCRQTIDMIGDSFYSKTGYNEWAESNDIVVVYPQTIRSLALGNPRGCWDWWGYTGALYYTKLSPQIQVVSNIARLFMKGSVRLRPLQSIQE